MTDRLIPLEEALDRLSVNRGTFYNRALKARKEGQPMPFGAVKIGPLWKVRESVVEATISGEVNGHAGD
tara:strand:- start:4779 stop:4985 length:207 start_codon:yes stop_codon:yes gene_type:complete